MPSLATKTLGILDLAQNEFYNFPDGLYGFPHAKEFAIIEENENSPFLWLQYTKQADLAFVIIEPHSFYKKKYIPEVSKTELESIKAKSIEECKIYIIVTIPPNNPSEMTANLQGPILVHYSSKNARQVISLNEEHQIRVPILGDSHNN